MAVYDVHLSPEGHIHCDCPGFEQHRKPCKHVLTLAKARMLPASVLVPRQPLPASQRFRSVGDYAAMEPGDFDDYMAEMASYFGVE